MKQRINTKYWMIMGAFLLCQSFFMGFVSIGAAYDLGLQASTRMSPLDIEEGLVGLKMDMGDFSITPRMGFGLADMDHGDDLFLFTIGAGFDYYLSDEQLRPYVGGDLFIDYVDEDGSDIAVTLNPHLGAEYRFSEKFSIGGNIGLQLGVGEFLGSDVRFGTTSMLHMTYYF